MFGIWNHPHASHVTYFGLHALQHRGQNGAGIATCDQGIFKNYRERGLLSDVFKNEDDLNQLSGHRAIGHTHYTLNGKADDIDNVEPYVFHFYHHSIAIAHNGNIINYKSLRKKLEEKGAVFHSESDSELLVHLLQTSQKNCFETRLEEALKQLQGAFSFLILTNDAMYAVVDPYCFRPLSIGQMNDGNSIVVASETCAFHALGAHFVRNVHAGHYAKITDHGIDIFQYNDQHPIAIESMEYIYFARPDSEFAGIVVHTARKNLGKRLAMECPIPKADLVIGVPNSSLSAGTGYAEASGLPYEMGLVKNQYIGRSFIEPTQELRDLAVRKKLSPVVGVVEGKSIVLVDDSIVRGTTSKRLIQMLRDAGAKEIHLRISSPPVRFPNYYGIDMSTTNELLGANHTIKEMNEYLGADSLGFLSVDGMIEAIGTKFNAPHNGLSLSIFNGHYIAGLGDYEESFWANLTPLQKRILKGENVDE